jgi:hypothetical protein
MSAKPVLKSRALEEEMSASNEKIEEAFSDMLMRYSGIQTSADDLSRR